MIKRPTDVYQHDQAHVYFGPGKVARVRALCAGAAELFEANRGRGRERPSRPHPEGSWQLTVDTNAFDRIIPWLETNRDGLDVFVHGQTDGDLADHTTHATWLGREHTLKLYVFR